MKILSKGITLVEIIIAIFIIGTLSLILISDFPKIQRQYALSSVTYKLAQDLRKTQDLGLSGVPIKDENGNLVSAKGYGIYINLSQSATQYLIYADSCIPADRQYTPPSISCPDGDYIIKPIIDVSKQNQNLSISGITDSFGGSYNSVSINFNPPNPTTTITTDTPLSGSEITIILELKSDNSFRKVRINTSGLINVVQ